MIAEIATDHDSLIVLIKEPRLDGQVSLFEFFLDNNIIHNNVEKIIFDFNHVTYINSLGIAEFISLMRYLSEKRPKLKYRFVNVEKKISKIFKMIELTSIADIESR
ncbi:MAG: hypothetical protein OEV66_08490 [Spirochaetia bacterium]|nr:hypothetical protein [Spirochaetia bacterium]